jgi:Flp pilus assembly protein TadD
MSRIRNNKNLIRVIRGIRGYTRFSPMKPRTVLVTACTLLLLVLALLTYRQSGTYRNMETLWRRTISANPGSAMAHNNLGLLLVQQDNPNEAMYYLERATQLAPDNAEAHNNFGGVLRGKGWLEDAATQFRQAVELEPNRAAYRANLGSVLAEAGRIDEAIVHFDAAVKAAPSDPFIANNLAWLLATLPTTSSGNPQRAVELAERAVQLSQGNPVTTGTLAAAYAAAGRFEDAIAQAERARDLAHQQGNRRIADLSATMLESFRAKRPFR